MRSLTALGIVVLTTGLSHWACSSQEFEGGAKPVKKPKENSDSQKPENKGTYGSEPSLTKDIEEEIDHRVTENNGQTGELQISLIWNNYNDLDLHVATPSGSIISYQNPVAAGGTLDIDMNVFGESTAPVENIFWRNGTAPRGRYRVYVVHFQQYYNINFTEFNVKIKIKSDIKTFQGSVKYLDKKLIYEFDY